MHANRASLPFHAARPRYLRVACALLLAALALSAVDLHGQVGAPALETQIDPPESLQPAEGKRYRVDLLTIEPGDVVFFTWGHTAIRIYDRETDRDIVFDYGIFNFDENFVPRFLSGQPAYMLGAVSRRRSFAYYQSANRRIYGQELRIDDERAGELLQQLALNSLPQNRMYAYHHYANNCTTKVRDIADQILGGALKARFEDAPAETTYRHAGTRYSSDDPIFWLALHLIQGPFVDQAISEWQEMFLPLVFMENLDEYRLVTKDERIGEIELHQDNIAARPAPTPIANWAIFLAIFLAALAIFYIGPALRPDVRARYILGAVGRHAWYVAAGSIGTLLLFFWVATPHDSMDANLNALIFAPALLLMPLAALIFRKRADIQAKLDAIFVLVIFVCLLLAMTTIWDQFVWPFVLPALVIQNLIYQRTRRLAELQRPADNADAADAADVAAKAGGKARGDAS